MNLTIKLYSSENYSYQIRTQITIIIIGKSAHHPDLVCVTAISIAWIFLQEVYLIT